MVKKELSERYYNHYLSLNNPADLPQTAAPPAPEDTSPPIAADASVKDEPAAGPAPLPEDKSHQPAASLSLDEDLAGIAEVTPIQPKLSPPPKTAVELAEEIISEKTAKRKFCFIATAAYGSPLAQEVVLLQSFRDHYLARHVLGEKFIQAYYRFSPALAGQISHHQVLKLLTRGLLTPIILLIKKSCRPPGISRN